SLEVRRPVFYATAAVAVAFLPILMMSGLQGAFFRPLSIAFLLAVGLSLLVAMSATPALAAIVMQNHTPRPEAAFLARCKRWQLRTIEGFDRRPRLLLGLLIATGVLGIVLLPLLGARLLPDFRENYLIAHTTLRPGISITETARISENISTALARIPGIKSVAAQIGRAENGQDPDTPNKTEIEVQIDPTSGHTATDIDAAIRDVFDDYPNELTEIYSVLAERIGETLSGESAPFSVSVFGADLEVDDKVAGEIAEVLEKVKGSGTVRLVVPPRQPELRVALKPDALALYGLSAGEALDTINAAFHGSRVAAIQHADRTVPIAIRIAGAGSDPRAVGALLLRSRDGALVPLGKVADIQTITARSMI